MLATRLFGLPLPFPCFLSFCSVSVGFRFGPNCVLGARIVDSRKRTIQNTETNKERTTIDTKGQERRRERRRERERSASK